MKNKIDEMTKSIKSKLSFDDYTPSIHNDIKTLSPKDIETSEHNSVIPDKHNEVNKLENNDVVMSKHNAIKKVKRTFYILESVAEQLDALYAKKLTEKKKIDKSDIVTQALTQLFEDSECEIKSF